MHEYDNYLQVPEWNPPPFDAPNRALAQGAAAADFVRPVAPRAPAPNPEPDDQGLSSTS